MNGLEHLEGQVANLATRIKDIEYLRQSLGVTTNQEPSGQALRQELEEVRDLVKRLSNIVRLQQKGIAELATQQEFHEAFLKELGYVPPETF